MEPFILVRARYLRKTTKLPYPDYNVNNLKYWRVKYSNNRWDTYKIKTVNVIKYSKDEFINKFEENANKKGERIVQLKIELIIPHEDHDDSVMLYDFSAWDFGGERPGKWVTTQQELDQLVATVKNV